MTNKKILVLSTYPLKDARHGGQKRTEAIYEAYKHEFARVRHCAIFYKGFYADYDSDDIPLGPDSEALVMQSPLTGDIVCGEAIFKDPKVKAVFTQLLINFEPDIIHIEQPFQYLGLKPLLEQLQLQPKLIFGSQNIEAPMKREILEGIHVPEKDIVPVEKIIDDVERELSQVADLVIACTKSDLAAHKVMGARNLVLASNGIAESHTTPSAKKHWLAKFQKMGVTKTVLFVGSAHPPNWTGFLDMVGKGLGFVPLQARIVAAGSISDYFDREVSADTLDVADATFWLRAFSAGRLSEDSLGALIQLSNVILLPITEGGGSNLKTAEAILANKKVVATDHALRSFEWFKDFPNVWVANNQADFQRCIVTALATPFVARTMQQEKDASRVEWKNCLRDMVQEAAKI
jgi:hypothetical protein